MARGHPNLPAAEPGRTCAGGWGSCPRRGKAVCAHAGGRGPRLRPRGASRVEHPRPRLAGPGDAASCARGLRDRRRGGLRSARRPSGPAPSRSAGPAGWRFERPARPGGSSLRGRALSSVRATFPCCAAPPSSSLSSAELLPAPANRQQRLASGWGESIRPPPMGGGVTSPDVGGRNGGRRWSGYGESCSPNVGWGVRLRELSEEA